MQSKHARVTFGTSAAMLLFGILGACKSHHDDQSETDSSSHVALDANAFCNKAVTTCGDTSTKVSDCVATFAAVRVTPDCADALETASCSDLATTTSSVDDVCFPSCSQPGSQSCNGDGTLSVCGSSSKALVYDCAATCTAVKKTWTGVCGTSNEGQTSPKPKCWCK